MNNVIPLRCGATPDIPRETIRFTDDRIVDRSFEFKIIVCFGMVSFASCKFIDCFIYGDAVIHIPSCVVRQCSIFRELP